MPRVLTTLEIETKGEAKIKQTSASLKELGATGEAAKSVLQGIGMGIGQLVFDRAIDGFRAMVTEVNRVVAAAAELSDLSAKTMMSVESLQRLEYAAKQSGTSLGQVTAAALKAQIQLERAPKAFEKWGLSVSALKAMRPEEQLAAIAARIREIDEPTKQAAAAFELMGRRGAEMLPLLRSDLGDLIKEADDLGGTMSGETVASLDAVDDASARLSQAIGGLVEQIIASNGGAAEASSVLNDLAKVIALVNTAAQKTAGLKKFVTLAENLAGLTGAKQWGKLGLMVAAGYAERGPGVRTGQATFGATPETMEAEAERILQRALQQTAIDVKAVVQAEKERAKSLAKINALIKENTRAREKDFERVQFEAGRLGGQAGFGAGHAGMFGTGPLPGEGTIQGGMTPEELDRYIKAQREVFEIERKMDAELGAGRDTRRAQAIEDQIQAFERLERQVWDVFDAVMALVGAYQQGRAAGNKWEGAAGGALQGMQTGGQIGGPMGAAIGTIVGGIAGFLGGKKGEKEQEDRMMQQSLSNMLSGMQEAIEKLAEIRRRTQEVVGAGASGLEAMFKAATTPEQFERLGRFALAGIQAMKEQGFSLVDIFKTLGPALDAAIEKMSRLGKGRQTGTELATGEEGEFFGPFEELLNFRKLVTENEELIRSVEGTVAVITMLSETGMLSGQTLTDVFAQLQDDYTALEAAGFTHIQILALQADSYRELLRLQAAGVITIDEATMARIREAEAAGLLDPTPQERMQQSLDLQLLVLAGIAQMFKVTLPAAVQDYINSINRIPTVPTPGGDGNGEGGGPTRPPPGRGRPDNNARGFEGWVTRPTTKTFGEAGPEHVSIRTPGQTNGGDGGGGTTIVYIGGEKLDGVISRRVRTGYIGAL